MESICIINIRLSIDIMTLLAQENRFDMTWFET